ncbi:MAG: AraC family transcriptional regulator [Firmicutes bacterium]|nr:AraC family transcriptional regulator [Bacillota bacterium]
MDAYKENPILSEPTFPVEVFLCDNLKKPIKGAPHWHDCIEIIYMLEGTAVQQINDRCFRVRKNDIVIANSGVIHDIKCTAGEEVRYLVIKFSPGVIYSSYANIFESKYIMMFLNSSHQQSYHIADTFKHSEDIVQLMMGIYHEFLKKEAGYEIYIKGYIYQLVACLVRNEMLGSCGPADLEKKLKKIDPLLKYIERDYAEEISLEKAANMVNMNYHYFSKYFKKAIGKNFKEYVDFVRVCEAEKLLLSEDMSITQIAYDVGFSNVSSFNRVFKRVKHYPPSAIKKSKTAKN